MKPLSSKQQQIYDYIVAFSSKHGYPPSVREIGDFVGLKSPSTVHFHLKSLKAAGLISQEQGKTRAITISGGPGRLSLNSQAQALREQANRVPIVGNVAAGSPILAEECIEDYLIFDTGGLFGEHFALRVRGESMLGAGILPDDLVVVRRQQSASSGEIVVALLGDEATVKRLSHRNGGVWLLPENDAFQPIDGRNALVLGKVTAVVRQYS